MQRVAIVVQTTAVGGMETHAIDLAAEYVRRGLHVLAVTPEGSAFDAVATRFRAAGADVHRLDTDARGGRRRQLTRWLRFSQLIRTWEADVVHLHTGGATGGLAVIGAARLLTQAAVVLTEHDVPTERPSAPQRLARAVMDRLLHALIAVSRRNARLRVERLGAPRDRYAVILNGVPVSTTSTESAAQARSQIRAEHGIPDDAVVLGCVVRLADGKGLEDLLRAFAIVRQSAPAHLLVVGDGPLREQLEALAQELEVSSFIHFAGYRANPGPMMHAMDVFALAVPAGSMSIALLEAMARGLPPVITFGGPEEAVIPGETGLTAPPNDPPGLAAALLGLVEQSSLRTRLATAAAEHQRRHFSVQRVADDMLEVYTAATRGAVPIELRADAPANPRPGDRLHATATLVTTA